MAIVFRDKESSIERRKGIFMNKNHEAIQIVRTEF